MRVQQYNELSTKPEKEKNQWTEKENGMQYRYGNKVSSKQIQVINNQERSQETQQRLH